MKIEISLNPLLEMYTDDIRKEINEFIKQLSEKYINKMFHENITEMKILTHQISFTYKQKDDDDDKVEEKPKKTRKTRKE